MVVKNSNIETIYQKEIKSPDVLEKRKLLEQKIRSELIEYIYPKEVARKLGIKTWQVYQYMENLSEEESKKLRKDRLKNNKLYSVVVSRKKKEKEKGNTKGGIVEKILYDMKKSFIDVETRINLARIYFILENGKAAEKILSEMYYDDTSYSDSSRSKARRELEKVQLENLAMKLRNEYRNGRNMDGSKISYNDLCSRYSVRTGEVIDVLGMENSEQEL